mgnify:CR=1 FL=1
MKWQVPVFCLRISANKNIQKKFPCVMEKHAHFCNARPGANLTMPNTGLARVNIRTLYAKLGIQTKVCCNWEEVEKKIKQN